MRTIILPLRETQLFRTFSQLAPAILIQPQLALKTQRVMDACLASARGDGQKVAL